MKHLSNNKVLFGIVLITLLMFAVPAIAVDMDTCKSHAELASAIMLNRQNGTPLAKMLEMNANVPDSQVQRIHYILVEMAYRQPKYQSLDYRQQTVTDFSNKILLGCMQMLDN